MLRFTSVLALSAFSASSGCELLGNSGGSGALNPSLALGGAALVSAPGVGGVSALGPAVSGVLVQGARGVVFVPLAAPGASGVSGEALAATLSALVDGPPADGLAAADIGIISAWGQAAVLAPAIASALVEACRIVGELETAELHWHGSARNAKARFKLILRAAAWAAIPASAPLCILRAGFPRLRVGRG